MSYAVRAKQLRHATEAASRARAQLQQQTTQLEGLFEDGSAADETDSDEEEEKKSPSALRQKAGDSTRWTDCWTLWLQGKQIHSELVVQQHKVADLQKAVHTGAAERACEINILCMGEDWNEDDEDPATDG